MTTTVDGPGPAAPDRVSDAAAEIAPKRRPELPTRGDLNDTGLQRVAHDAGVVDRGDLVRRRAAIWSICFLSASGPLAAEATGDQVVAGVASLTDDLPAWLSFGTSRVRISFGGSHIEAGVLPLSAAGRGEAAEFHLARVLHGASDLAALLRGNTGHAAGADLATSEMNLRSRAVSL